MTEIGGKAKKDQDESVKQLEELELRTRMDRIKRKILVLSGKGGVGKSTVAANLALALAQRGQQTGLLDADLHGPSITGLFGLDGRRLETLADGLLTPLRFNENLKIVSVGLLTGKADAVIWRGPMKYGVIRQLLKDVDWGDLDCLVVDSPPGTGDEPLSIAQLAGQHAAALIVTTPQQLAVADVRRGISFCRKLELPVLGIIENMSGFVCPHCGRPTELFGAGGGEGLARETGVPFLGKIPLAPEIVAGGDAGRPLLASHPAGAAALAFGKIVATLLGAWPGGNKVITKTEATTMKIAIPTAGKKLCLHFGHCDEFALIEVEPNTKKILKTEYLVPPPHEPGVLPKWLSEQGAAVIIAGGMGQRAQGLFQQAKIKVVVGAMTDDPAELVAAYLNGTLRTGGNVCDH